MYFRFLTVSKIIPAIPAINKPISSNTLKFKAAKKPTIDHKKGIRIVHILIL